MIGEGDKLPGEAVPSPKMGPEALVLRGSPPHAIRFRRGLLVSLAALVAVGTAAIAIKFFW